MGQSVGLTLYTSTYITERCKEQEKCNKLSPRNHQPACSGQTKQRERERVCVYSNMNSAELVCINCRSRLVLVYRPKPSPYLSLPRFREWIGYSLSLAPTCGQAYYSATPSRIDSLHLRYNFSTSQVSVAEGRDFRLCHCHRRCRRRRRYRRRRELVNCDDTTTTTFRPPTPPIASVCTVHLPLPPPTTSTMVRISRFECV